MSEFINTIDVLGDDVVMDSLIDRSITEFKDSTINSQIRRSDTFAYCTQLTTVHLPNATFYASTAAGYNFRSCSALTDVDISSATALGVGMFSGCRALEKIVLPSVTKIHNQVFTSCTNLRMIDFHQALTGIGSCFTNCTSLSAFILRSTTLTPMTVANVFSMNFTCPISSGTGYIYVPSALVDSYKAATNWSTYADQFRALEDWTVDGTITGEMREYCQSLALNAMELTFTDTNTQTLTATRVLPGILDEITWETSDSLVASVNNGVITPVSDGTAIITATCGDHSATCIVAVNAGLERPLYNLKLTPYNGSEEGELPVGKLDVTAGTKLEITYYLTRKQGYVWDGRKCGLQYQLNDNVVGAETTVTVTVSSNGTILFSGHNTNDYSREGQLANTRGDRLYGKYLRVTVI